MSNEDVETIAASWGLPPRIIDAILSRRCHAEACDTLKIIEAFLPFSPDFPAFFDAARGGEIDIRMAGTRNTIIRFDRIETDKIEGQKPNKGQWFLMRDFTVVFGRIAENYRSFCHALGKDSLAEVTAYAHGSGVHAPRHTDLSGGLVFMLRGRRQWRVEPPLESGDGIFEPLLTTSWGHGFSKNAQFIETDEGDALYIPGGWWHEVRSLEPSLTLRIGIAERTSGAVRPKASV